MSLQDLYNLGKIVIDAQLARVHNPPSVRILISRVSIARILYILCSRFAVIHSLGIPYSYLITTFTHLSCYCFFS